MWLFVNQETSVTRKEVLKENEGYDETVPGFMTKVLVVWSSYFFLVVVETRVDDDSVFNRAIVMPQ